jgi:hyperosmotically inducible protein
MKTSPVNNAKALRLLAAGILLLGGSPLRASDTDERIEWSAKKSYVFKHYLANDSIKAVSKNGAVTLTGTVAEESHLGLANDTIEGLAGVKSVDNRLTVEGEHPTKHSDRWVEVNVKNALLFLRNVRATKTDVKDGVVSLRGEASSLAQKELAAEYAKDVEDVTEVKNDMIIANITDKPDETIGQTIDDASITAQVKMSLLSHRSTSASKTKVETTTGVVTLTGVAKNSSQKALVTKLATDVNGVSSVVNNMTCQPAVSKSASAPLPPRDLRVVSE